MAFYPDVSPGQPFHPSSLLSNDVRHLINGVNGFGSNGLLGAHSGVVRIQVYNMYDTELPAKSAVSFNSGGGIADGVIPCMAYVGGESAWGVLVQPLKAGEAGDCIISGPAEVESLSGSGAYCKPSVANPLSFECGAVGVPVVYSDSSTNIINIGSFFNDEYDGPFALSVEGGQVKVKLGYVNQSGTWKVVPGETLAPENGLVCVSTEPPTDSESEGADTEWTTPVIEVTTPGLFSYPIGRIDVNGSNVSVLSFRVPVAVFVVRNNFLGVELPGRVVYDTSGETPKFVQYKLKWNNAQGKFVEEADPTLISDLESHSSQHGEDNPYE